VSRIKLLALASLCASGSVQAQNTPAFDAATAFGARQSVAGMTLSPDGTNVAYISPTTEQGSQLSTLGLAKGSRPKVALSTDGKPYRLEYCGWVSNTRLACKVYAVMIDPTFGPVGLSRMLAVDSDGKNARVLSMQENTHTRGFAFGGGNVIDWLPDEDGALLMSRVHLPDDHIGTKLGSSAEGLGVDWVDTRTLAFRQIEPPSSDAVEYISDGRGTVRIMGIAKSRRGGQQYTGATSYLYRLPGSRSWETLGDYNSMDRTGFNPFAVDHDLNVAYGFKKKDGRLALYSVKLDESLQEQLIYARPDVDVDGLISIGRRHRVVGTSYVTDVRKPIYFALDIGGLTESLSRALKYPALDIVDSSVDENKLMVFAGTDADPGVYYIFDRKSHELATFLVARNELEGVKLATVKPITYPAGDGVSIPAYLTLPPGHETAKGLPAIVLPHGGPRARQEWGFDWLPQFYASRGYAVLEPNFRGSSGYGDAWLQRDGFKSWPVAIGDVLAGAHWLVSEGIADPSKLAIVGWSYGGYAALQSAVVDPTVFKAVVAIAPVTDLAAFKEEHRRWSDFDLISEFVGSGPQMHEGSPSERADKIKAPVLLFHGAHDNNVSIEQSKRMAERLTAAGGKCELVTWEDLDHFLEDSKAREAMLRKSDEFIRRAFGM
jgi:acetyl esterase/lipase